MLLNTGLMQCAHEKYTWCSDKERSLLHTGGIKRHLHRPPFMCSVGVLLVPLNPKFWPNVYLFFDELRHQVFVTNFGAVINLPADNRIYLALPVERNFCPPNH